MIQILRKLRKRLIVQRIRREGPPWTIVSDLDGVLTPGTFLYSESGKVLKEFGSHDADAIKYFHKRGLDFYFVSADRRGFVISRRRVEDMGFSLQLLDPDERCELIINLQATHRVIYVGDSSTDLPALQLCDLPVIPRGSFGLEGVSQALYLSRRGGDGAMAELLFTLFDDKKSQ